MPEAGGAVIIDHADGLHEGIDNGASDKFESPLFQIPTHGVGFLAGGWQNGIGCPAVNDRFAIYEGPKMITEAAEFLHDFQIRLGIGDGGFDLQSISNDA
jgi:hypothetical protein